MMVVREAFGSNSLPSLINAASSRGHRTNQHVIQTWRFFDSA